jgi:hypothetical protein
MPKHITEHSAYTWKHVYSDRPPGFWVSHSLIIPDVITNNTNNGDSMFKSDRIFFEGHPTTGSPNWFFASREGTMGPYDSRQIAEQALADQIAKCQEQGVTGGRDTCGAGEPACAEA